VKGQGADVLIIDDPFPEKRRERPDPAEFVAWLEEHFEIAYHRGAKTTLTTLVRRRQREET